MRILSETGVAVLCVVLFGGAAAAAGPDAPKVEYSATMTAGAPDGTMKMKVWHAKGKERREMTMGGEESVQILRFDKNLLWVLMPGQRMYMEAPAEGNESLTDMSGHDTAKMTKVGKESVNGVKATKYRMTDTDTDGSQTEGFVWMTKDGVAVKYEVTTGEGRMTMELSDLKVGKQDPKLFELPAGYKKFDLGAMMQGAQDR